MRHDGHAPVVADQLHSIAESHILHGHERRAPLREIIEVEVDVRHVAPLAALHIGPQQGRMVFCVGEHHLGDQFARGELVTGGGQHRIGIHRKAQTEEVIDHTAERRHDLRGDRLLQPREIRRTPVDAVAQQVQVRAPVIAVDLDARNEAQARSGGPFGGLADAPHRIVVGQRKGVQSAGRTHINDCGDGKFPVAAVSGMDMQVESIHNQ